MTRKKFSKPSQRGTRKFSTNLVLNENGILQSDTTPRTWREIEDTSSDIENSEENTDDSSESNLEIQPFRPIQEKQEEKKVPGSIIEIQNPNRTKKQNFKPSDLSKMESYEPSRREREAMEKKAAEERYRKLHSEGKTEKARADLARLAIVRKEREEKARQRKAEQEAKESALQARAEKIKKPK